MTRDERHRWCFAHKDGQHVVFKQDGMPFKIFHDHAVWGGIVEIGGTRCRVRIVRNKGAEKGKRNEVYFPDAEWKLEPDSEGTLRWTDKLTMEETTLVGYLEIKGNWREGAGSCLFHPVLKRSDGKLSNG